MKKYRTSDKVMSRKLAKKEVQIVKEIATPKHRYFKLWKLTIHRDIARVRYCTEGNWHDPVYFPAQIRFIWWGRVIRIKTVRRRGRYGN